MDKKEVAEVLEEVAALLELKRENPFKSRAYLNAARALRTLQGDLTELVASGRLKKIRGIGETLQRKITELVTTGKLEYHQQLRAPYPPGFMEMLKIPGIGARKLKIVWEKLGISNIDELERACHENRLSTLEGFGPKTQEKILNGIKYAKQHHGLHLLHFAHREGETLLQALGAPSITRRISLAGSLRRCKEVVQNVDIVASSDNPAALIQQFVALPQVDTVLARADASASVRVSSGINADLRVVTEREFPCALRYFTGSEEHNAALRARAKEMGLDLREYGLFRGKKLVPCATEEEIFAALDLAYIPPELRENLGEIEAAAQRSLPELVTEKDLQGILHVHSTYSDGVDTLETMVRTAAALGFRYIGISDHSKSAFYAHGLSEAEVARQHLEIAQLQKSFPQIRIFKGIESDILADGSLDYDTAILDSFDFVIGSIHSRFKMDETEMTARIIRATENRYLTVLGHPTGRLLLTRESYPVNLRKVIDAAVANGVAVEINGQPQRLELDWRFGKYAAEKGAVLSINPDAHNTKALSDVANAVAIARKSWLNRDQILNARDPDGFLQFSLARR